ncbi:unnamed protein product [Phytophthora fragariaefolia]|uniref:Unnamed protein product n=1 Tax=Phytophthora fragariaefolia TaxID=1490495 RepID=A0A9W6TQT8_9STRA|nr:unnamed protein product [Phytophthora fragariaefolia]
MCVDRERRTGDYLRAFGDLSGQKGLSAKRLDSCRGAALEMDVILIVEAVGDTMQKKSTSVVGEQHDDAQAGKDSVGKDDVATSGRENTAGEDDRSIRSEG